VIVFLVHVKEKYKSQATLVITGAKCIHSGHGGDRALSFSFQLSILPSFWEVLLPVRWEK
jgi:hypothetical protein